MQPNEEEKLEQIWTDLIPQIENTLHRLEVMYWTFLGIRWACTLAIYYFVHPFVSDWFGDADWYVYYGMIAVAILIIWYPFYLITTSITDSKYKGQVLPRLIQSVLPGCVHQSNGNVTKDEIQQSRLYHLDSDHTFESEDHINGKVADRNFDCNELTINYFQTNTNDSETIKSTDFRGIFLKVRLPQPLQGTTLMASHSRVEEARADLPDLHLVKLDGPSAPHAVYSTIDAEAAALFNPTFLQQLNDIRADLKQLTDRGSLSLSFIGNHMYALVNTNSDMFEACESLDEARVDFIMLSIIRRLVTLPNAVGLADYKV